MYNEKLARFFKEKNLKQKEVGRILGFSGAMIGRYLHGTANIGPRFLISLSKNFPEVDLNDIFATQNVNPNALLEPNEKYHATVLTHIREIENRIQKIKEKLSENTD
ncbi:MAG: helix-turn-helix transcriptional regulator [Flavobacterium sp.]